MKTLTYKGIDDYIDPLNRFIAKPGDKVEFTEAEAKEKLKSSDWEEGQNGNKRKSRAGTNSNIIPGD